MENTYLIDTNVLVYAYNQSVAFHNKALVIVENALNQKINGAVADKNLYEFYAVITDSRRVEKPISSNEAIDIIDFVVSSNIRVVYSTPFVFLKTFELARKYDIKKQDLFDIHIVALMIGNKIGTIITANEKDFKKIEEIKVWNPFA